MSSGLFLVLNRNLKKESLENKKFAKNINFNSEELKKTIKYTLKNKNKIKSFLYKKKSFNYVKKISIGIKFRMITLKIIRS